MRRLILGILLLALLAAGTIVVLAHEPALPAGPAAPAIATPATPDAAVTARGHVVPAHSVELSFVSPDTVTEVLVREGDTVEKDAVLARLDVGELQLRVDENAAALAQVRANYDRLLATSDQGIAQLDAEISTLRSDAEIHKLQALTPQIAQAVEDGLEANLQKLEAVQLADAKFYAAELAAASAQIQEAEATLKRSQLELERATLRAPMAGTVVALNVRVGQTPSLSEPAFVLADVSLWRIETSDLSERAIVQIKEGAPTTITFDALPNVSLVGKVEAIRAIGVTRPDSPDVTYTVLVTPDQQDDRLRWNMTAMVTFAAEK
jgi:multidrug efflux pump subunit AcrA (membrane-fusion protein)